MKRLLQWLAVALRLQKIRSRFLAAMIALSLPPLFILGYVSFDVAKRTLTDAQAQTNYDHLRTSSEVADLLFRNVENLHRSIVVNDELRDDLRDSVAEQDDANADIRDRTAQRLQRLINDNFLDTRFVDSVCLFDLDFRAYCLYRSDDAGRYEGSDKELIIPQTEWYQATFAAQGRVVYFSEDVLGESANTFSTVKLFRDAEDVSGRPIGLLLVNVSRSIFGTVFRESDRFGANVALDPAGASARLVYSNLPPGATPSIDGPLEAVVAGFRNEGYLVTQVRNETTKWTFLHLVKSEELLKRSNGIRWATTAIALIIAAVAVLASYIVSGSITRPLLTLRKMMLDWTKGERSFGETFRQDEVGVIAETFKRVAVENEALTERLVRSELKEREAELRALQAQIKPHFLYNTLDSIYWMATLQNNHQVAQMAVSLSESFKLSLNKGKETIPVYKELKHIEHYMTIQNIRYNNRFEYACDVDSAVMGMDILKLLLQPLVENAIYHGLEPKVGNGRIALTGKQDGEMLVFTVEDDGVGMEDTNVTERGYGLSNVRERLSLYYGDSSSLTVESAAGRGTKVTLRFDPRRTKEEPNDA
ncbi:sensor histidine kinase [Paenibacillus sp.]|uniref:sensor histidine kinase n=1 Tax=Paenibacillus sp. TaxID=58172 RepID=UPI002D5A3B62|nr:histidine kinase [Paenibacillus sp.]HZG86578.1 histidine kinase [Paenibacillus sp.]